MYFFYNFAVLITWFFLQITALFNPKIRQFVKGRKSLASYLEKERDPGKPLLWMHTASLGEFEQGLPVLDRLRTEYPNHQILVTFFSPSGYEVKKDHLSGILVAYLPMDTRWAVRRFLRLTRPQIALFVKYEVWPEIFRQLERRQIPILMISAIYRPRQAYFKWYGGFLRKTLKRADYFFVQDETSMKMLNSIGIQKASVCGDTRFDRVLEILEDTTPLSFMESFKGERVCLVGGSTWPEDNELLIPLINQHMQDQCFVIAPHKTDDKTIDQLQKDIQVPTARYSRMEHIRLETISVLIIDTIGLLTRIYGYADLAYVGGGFATGLHNTLEPAVYGIPVLIGPGYHNFREAEELVKLGGIAVVRNQKEFGELVAILTDDPQKRSQMGAVNQGYIHKNRGGSEKILEGIRRLLR